jgi:hypothetical protein
MGTPLDVRQIHDGQLGSLHNHTGPLIYPGMGVRTKRVDPVCTCEGFPKGEGASQDYIGSLPAAITGTYRRNNAFGRGNADKAGVPKIPLDIK